MANKTNGKNDLPLLAVSESAQLFRTEDAYRIVVGGKVISETPSKLGKYPKPPNGKRWQWLVKNHQSKTPVSQATFQDGAIKYVALHGRKTTAEKAAVKVS